LKIVLGEAEHSAGLFGDACSYTDSPVVPVLRESCPLDATFTITITFQLIVRQAAARSARDHFAANGSCTRRSWCIHLLLFCCRLVRASTWQPTIFSIRCIRWKKCVLARTPSSERSPSRSPVSKGPAESLTVPFHRRGKILIRVRRQARHLLLVSAMPRTVPAIVQVVRHELRASKRAVPFCAFAAYVKTASRNVVQHGKKSKGSEMVGQDTRNGRILQRRLPHR